MTHKHKRWDNTDLSAYYENVPPALFQKYSIKGGLEEGRDIHLAYPYFANAISVMEIGACYGRVIKQILKKGYKGKIYAIERSKRLFSHLKKKYDGKAHLINADIIHFQPEQKFEAILWLWSDISGFPREQQLSVLEHVSSWLADNGVLILETILHTLAPKNATLVNDQFYMIESEYGNLYGYIPSEQEMQSYGEQLGFRNIKHIHYYTSTDRERILHIFSNRKRSSIFFES